MRVQSADMRPSHTTHAETGTVRSARLTPATAGSKPGAKNYCPPPTSTSSSRCLGNFHRSRYRTNARSMACYSGPARRRCLKSPAIRSTSARRSDSSASSTHGIKDSSIIRTFIVVPAGGLAPDHSGWVHSQQKFFLPVRVLRKVFRGKFVDGLNALHAQDKLGFHGSFAALQSPKTFAAWLRPLFRSDWVVYSKRPFGGAQHALRYLGQYTHRVAISNHRLVALADGMVTFRWRDSAHKNKKRLIDSARQRVPSPVPSACAPAGIRPHPSLRADGASPPGRIAPALPETASGVRQSVQRSAGRRKGRFISSAAVELPTVRRPDGSHRTAHRHCDSLPLSASSGRPTLMTRSFSLRSEVMPKSHRYTCAQTAGPLSERHRSSLHHPRFYAPNPIRPTLQACLILLSGIQNP